MLLKKDIEKLLVGSHSRLQHLPWHHYAQPPRCPGLHPDVLPCPSPIGSLFSEGYRPISWIQDCCQVAIHSGPITVAGRCSSIKLVSTPQARNRLTPLVVPPDTLIGIIKPQRAFILASSSSVSGCKCKEKWETIYRQGAWWPQNSKHAVLCSGPPPSLAFAQVDLRAWRMNWSFSMLPRPFVLAMVPQWIFGTLLGQLSLYYSVKIFLIWSTQK